MSGRQTSLNWKDNERRDSHSSGHSKIPVEEDQMAHKRKPKTNKESVQKSKKNHVDCRRSTAAQFFVEEETVAEAVTSDRVVQLLNEAAAPKDKHETLLNLKIVQELIVCKEPKLLDNFLDEVISFQHDQNSDIRKFIVQFILDVCKQDIQILPKVIGNLIIMLHDIAVNVQKKVIQTTIQLYPLAIKWLSKVNNVDDIMVATWASMSQLKTKILAQLESDNEGVRVLVVKFMEVIVVIQTLNDQYYQDGLSLDKIPVILNIFRPRRLEEEAMEIFRRIVEFHGASHVSSLNLMACMQVLTTIGRKRFEFFPKVLQAFESLHANLPPTLSQSQVSSVRKNLKLQLFILVNHPASVEFSSQISIMLSDLGATPQQINRCFPSTEFTKKRSGKKSSETISRKKFKVAVETLNMKVNQSPSKLKQKNVAAQNSAIDVTAEELVSKFNTTNIADLVLVTMLNLPEVMPSTFQSTYTPIAAAGTDPQVKHLARLLATQLTLVSLGKGVKEIKILSDSVIVISDEDDDDDGSSKQIITVVGQTVDLKPKKQGLVLLPSGGPAVKTNRQSKRLDFQSAVKVLSQEESDRLSRAAYSRILNAEKAIAKRGGTAIRTKVLTSLATQFRGDLATDLRAHILENPRGRMDLVLSWIYQEYSKYRGFESSIEGSIECYEETINLLLSGILGNDEHNHALFSRFFIDPPCVTESMAECLKIICTDETATDSGLELATSMTVRRPTKKLLFLGVISDLTLHELIEVRTKAVNAAVEIHESGNMKSFIEAFALRSLKFLLSESPLASNFVYFHQPLDSWTEDLIKVSLHLYLSLLPINHQLIHDLGTVYVETLPDIKRTILRALELPVKGMSMASPELLHFVDNCPKGAETLVTRIIHILTDKAPPSAELVARVRDLYRKRVQDVRFLIPIINGLSKQEVLAALPELIKLNPTVVKEVFHRLLGNNFSSPVSPSELLVALHNIDSGQCNLKTIIKATSLCFEEKLVYTQVVLAMVLQQLMEANPLPILLMRTVIQSLANYPHLLGFVTNILQRLIMKKVWKQKKIWEGFIKCCQRTKPQSFQVLLQLPSVQLQEVLNSYPDLREPLCQYVDAFTDHQKAHISKSVMDVINSFIPKSKVEAETDVHIEGIDESTGEPLPPGQDHM